MTALRPDDGPLACDLDGPDRGGQLTGPWEQAFWFTIPFEIRSKSNHRNGGKGRNSWGSLSSFEDHLALLTRKHCPTDWELGADLPLRQRPAVVGFLYARTRLDALNLDKSVGDAVQGSGPHPGPVVVNDASILALTKLAQRCSTSTGGLLAFARLRADADLATVAAATCTLAAQVTTLLGLDGLPQHTA